MVFFYLKSYPVSILLEYKPNTELSTLWQVIPPFIPLETPVLDLKPTAIVLFSTNPSFIFNLSPDLFKEMTVYKLEPMIILLDNITYPILEHIRTKLNVIST